MHSWRDGFTLGFRAVQRAANPEQLLLTWKRTSIAEAAAAGQRKALMHVVRTERSRNVEIDRLLV